MLRSFQSFLDEKSDGNALSFGFIQGMKNPQKIYPDVESISDEWKKDVILSFSHYVTGFYASKALLILCGLVALKLGLPLLL